MTSEPRLADAATVMRVCRCGRDAAGLMVDELREAVARGIPRIAAPKATKKEGTGT